MNAWTERLLSLALPVALALALCSCHAVDGTFQQRWACSQQAGVGSGGLAELLRQAARDPAETQRLADRETCLKDHGL